jgi:hypothetical protein
MPVRQAQLGEAILKASSNFYNGLGCLSGRGKQSLRDRRYQAELGNEVNFNKSPQPSFSKGGAGAVVLSSIWRVFDAFSARSPNLR